MSPERRAGPAEAEVPPQGQGEDEEAQGGESASESQEERPVFPLVAEMLVQGAGLTQQLRHCVLGLPVVLLQAAL